MINKTIRVIKVGNEDNNVEEINLISENLQSNSYSVSGTSIGCCEGLLVEELERSVKYTDAVFVVGDVSEADSIVLWQAISKVFHQPFVTNRNWVKSCGMHTAYGTMYSKFLEHPGVTPVMYLQGLFVLGCEGLRQAISTIVVPILENLKAKLDYSRMLHIDDLHNNGVLDLLPCNDKVRVKYDVLGRQLSSTSMSALLDYEKTIASTFRNVECDISSDISDIVYKQRDLHVRRSVECIEECFKKYSPENVFVSFNGGKDCTVLLHLIIGVLKRNYPNFKGKLFCVYIESANPFTELNKFIDECRQYYNLDISKFNKSIKDSLSMVLDQKPNMKGVLMGTRRTDPFSDHLESFHMTDKNWPQIVRVSPLLDWHYSQIWDYLLHLKVPYCSLYEAGYTSLGSAMNTVPNPYLLVDDEQKTYLPAYKLLDASKERSGRKA